MLKKFVTKFEENLAVALSTQTNWGRNQLLLVIKSVITDTLLEVME
jgi:hypothetical protein